MNIVRLWLKKKKKKTAVKVEGVILMHYVIQGVTDVTYEKASLYDCKNLD